MATTIRVYVDGGASPAASGLMAADRTFSVPVSGVADGTHTFDVTAQEDGKAESPRVRVLNQSGSDQIVVARATLAASLSGTATISGSLSVPKPLAAALSATATVVVELTTGGASHPLAAALSASASVTVDLTTSSGSGTHANTPTFVAAGTAGASPGLPAGRATDDLLVLVAGVTVAPTGWTRVDGASGGGGLYHRWVDGSETSPSATYGQIAAFRGVNKSSPIIANSVYGSAVAPTTTVTAAAVDVGSIDHGLVLFGVMGVATDEDESNATISLGSPTGPATTQAFKSSSAAATQGRAAGLFYGAKNDTGSTGSESITYSGAWVQGAEASAILLVLNPAT